MSSRIETEAMAKREIATLCDEIVETLAKFIQEHKGALPEQLMIFAEEKFANGFVYGSVGEYLLRRVFGESMSSSAAKNEIESLTRTVNYLSEQQKTLRDQFAMAALTGDWGRDDGVWANTLPGPMGDLTAAKRYYEMADAMLKARNAIAVSGYDEDGNPICEHGNRINCDPCFKCEAKKGK